MVHSTANPYYESETCKRLTEIQDYLQEVCTKLEHHPGHIFADCPTHMLQKFGGLRTQLAISRRGMFPDENDSHDADDETVCSDSAEDVAVVAYINQLDLVNRLLEKSEILIRNQINGQRRNHRTNPLTRVVFSTDDI